MLGVLLGVQSLRTMTRASQDLYDHRIDSGSVDSGTIRSVSALNRTSTCIMGDSNTGGLKFGLDLWKVPSRKTPTVDHIDPFESCSYKNTVILCSINDIAQDNVKSPSNLKRVFNKYTEKIAEIQAVNKKLVCIYVSCYPLNVSI